MGVGPPHRRNPPPLYLVERGPGGEARSPAPEAVVFPHPPLICPPDGDWQMQDHPGAPGTARQGRTRIIVSTNDGGKATQPRAPGHDRPRTASFDAARHGRPRATPRAPGADVPPATTAGAPGQHRLSAVPSAPDHRSRARHKTAPGHGRPLAALCAVRHDRPCATPRAPGADVPPAITAEAPGQHCLSAVPPAPDHARSDARHQRAPGHGRPLAASSDAVRHDRPRATLRAPGADVPLATTAGAPGQHRLSAVANATVALPAGQRRLRQVILPRTPATPRTPTYPHSYRDTAHSYTTDFRAIPSPSTAGGPQGGQPTLLPLSKCWRGGQGVRSPSHQVQPAIQVPPHPRSCSAACTGLLHQHPSRAPPTPTHRLVVAACAAIHVPPQRGGDHRGATLCSLYALWLKSLPRESRG